MFRSSPTHCLFTMKLSKKGEYALRAMIALARNGGAPMTITQVAEAQNIPKKFLEQILLALKGAGMLVSRAGPRGGYTFAPEQPAASMTVGRILAAVEEPIARSRPTGPNSANSNGGIPATPTRVLAMLDEIRSYVRQKLDTLTVEELAAQGLPHEQVEALMWYI